jgi:hypothetical protein
VALLLFILVARCTIQPNKPPINIGKKNKKKMEEKKNPKTKIKNKRKTKANLRDPLP